MVDKERFTTEGIVYYVPVPHIFDQWNASRREYYDANNVARRPKSTDSKKLDDLNTQIARRRNSKK